MPLGARTSGRCRASWSRSGARRSDEHWDLELDSPETNSLRGRTRSGICGRRRRRERVVARRAHVPGSCAGRRLDGIPDAAGARSARRAVAAGDVAFTSSSSRVSGFRPISQVSVLDIGCGDASLLVGLLEHASAVTATGIDFLGSNWEYAQSACEIATVEPGSSRGVSPHGCRAPRVPRRELRRRRLGDVLPRGASASRRDDARSTDGSQ